ncbi:MAG: peptidoglycan-binding protein [Christensenellaceae bacterium]|jgi:hypothetical protein|nr:peptidoglycan-binding protein [Christensenellaceae bacterium]
MLNEFIQYLEEQLRNHSIYVWGAQGQQGGEITEEWIKGRETSEKNAKRAMEFWKAQCEAGFGDVLRAFDCSGLAMYFLQNMKGILKSDTTANGLLRNCEKLAKADVRRGDWVFKTYTKDSDDGKQKKGEAYHIGYVVDGELNVIEAKGRDDGVVKRPLKAGGWNAYGRPSFFKADIEPAAPDTPTGDTTPQPQAPPAAGGGFEVSRVLKITKPLVKGDDVAALQNALIARSFGCGAMGADGIYGRFTAQAVRHFQSMNRLIVDGRAGKFTVTALGGTWKE